MNKIILIYCFLFSPKSWALECKWWQSKVKASIISQHSRDGHTVSNHPRKEHCREKWKGADQSINQFRDDSIPGWINKGETFKKWKHSEIQEVSELLSKLPRWVKVNQYTFRRADRLIYQRNPATSELTKKTIILYDNFFTFSNKLGAIGHEASHFLFQELTDLEISEFEK